MKRSFAGVPQGVALRWSSEILRFGNRAVPVGGDAINGVLHAFLRIMITLGVIFGVSLLAGGGLVWRELARAPLGMQDESGFHSVHESPLHELDSQRAGVISEGNSEQSAQTA